MPIRLFGEKPYPLAVIRAPALPCEGLNVMVPVDVGGVGVGDPLPDGVGDPDGDSVGVVPVRMVNVVVAVPPLESVAVIV